LKIDPQGQGPDSRFKMFAPDKRLLAATMGLPMPRCNLSGTAAETHRETLFETETPLANPVVNGRMQAGAWKL